MADVSTQPYEDDESSLAVEDLPVLSQPLSPCAEQEFVDLTDYRAYAIKLENEIMRMEVLLAERDSELEDLRKHKLPCGYLSPERWEYIRAYARRWDGNKQ